MRTIDSGHVKWCVRRSGGWRAIGWCGIFFMKQGGEKISAMELLAQLQGSGSQSGTTQSLDLSHYARLALRNI
jgi:hypothetical protein